jgi:hypothetical protein
MIGSFYRFTDNSGTQFGDTLAATKALSTFNRRWFGGQMITAEFIDPTKYPV